MIEPLPRGTSGRAARQIAVAAARSAGAEIRKHFGTARVLKYKGRGNLVTQADLDSERAILSLLRQEYPAHGIVSEESPALDGASPFTWIVDPLDGTTNFASALPLFAVSIALVENGEPALAVIYDPLRRELFVAERGRGAFLGGRRIVPADAPKLENAVAAFDLGYDEQARRHAMNSALALRPNVMTLRLIGSAVLGQAYVACGRFDCYFHCYLYPWDVAAGHLLLREAGAAVSDWNGRPATIESHTLVAAHRDLHGAVVGTLSGDGSPAK